jgi:PTS system mannose-specific IIA component
MKAIGLVIIAHAPLASALASCARHVYGELRDLEVLDVPANAEPAALLDQARAAVDRADAGQGVLVLTDLFGATPANVAGRLAGAVKARVAVLAGANLPMLLRALSYRHLDLEELVHKALTGATQGVLRIGSTAQQNQASRKTDDENARSDDQQ